MAMTTYVIIFGIFITTVTMIFPLIAFFIKGKNGPKIKWTSYLSILLIIINLIAIFSGVYKSAFIAEKYFVPITSFLTLFGFTALVIETKNNKLMALPIAGATLLNGLLFLIVIGISNM